MSQPSEPADPVIPADVPALGRWRRFKAWARRRREQLWLAALIVAAIIIFLAPDIFITIGAGQAGVLWKRFGGGTQTVAPGERPFIGRIAADRTGEPTVLRERVPSPRPSNVYPYSEGMQVVWPWDRMTIYDIRLQQVSHVFDVLTSDGLDVKAEITVRFKPIEGDLGKLHRDIGPNYVNVLIIPTVGAYAREEIARHESSALYSPERLAIQEAIRAKTKQALISRYYPEKNRESYVIVEDVLIRGIELPPAVRAAIDEKVAQKHLAESYRYRLDRETQEAERKAIEAGGIRRFQEAVNGNISDGYLKWKAIEAMLELAKSQNAKVVVIGGKDGVPVIIGGADGTTTAPRR
jgi:regulator of protease activity HflC (stomatin/prohibitin superfamily)